MTISLLGALNDARKRLQLQSKLIDDMVTALETVEWCVDYSWCPICTNREDVGHTQKCLIGSALASYEDMKNG